MGSLAHLTMLSRTRLIPSEDARAIREQLVAIWKGAQAGTLVLADEEDVHMAVEAEITRVLGERAGLLHTARSRNDQVALDLRLHVREKVAEVLGALARLLEGLAARAEAERETLLPSYTHRQRAQPISLAYLLCGYGAMFTRDVDALGFVLEQVDVLPLGVGAIGGTSLPIDREVTRELLRFPAHDDERAGHGGRSRLRHGLRVRGHALAAARQPGSHGLRTTSPRPSSAS